jgi:endonuclease/exonuclease/phosphatase family metal-dependent hydrolase
VKQIATRLFVLICALFVGTLSAAAQTLPSAWASKDIGAVGLTGAASGASGSLTVDGAGADVWGSADALHFAYTPLTGDGSIVTRVTSIENVNAWTKAGVMMRESLNANARQAFMLVSPGKGLAFQRRTATGSASTSTSGGAGTAPGYVKLTRTGSTIRAYKSSNGSTWTLVGSDTIAMAQKIYVGVGVSSHVKGNLATVAFDETKVTVAPPASGPPSVTEPPSTPAGTLRLLHWNTYHGGRRTDGVYDPANLVSWIKQFNPDIMTLNEVDSTAQATTIMSELRKQMPGANWDYHYDLRGNMIVSRFAIQSKSTCLVNSAAGRKATHISVLVNGKPLNVWNAHLALDSSAMRTAETRAIQACESNWAEARIVAGDFNMQAGTAEHKSMLEGHADAWTTAKTLGTAVNYSGNCDGCTRNSRIDYIFTSKGATSLALKSVQMFDTRNAKGAMASDHKPMLAIYNLK